MLARLRSLWQRAKSERASPREIGAAVLVGVFAGCTPAVGVHGWIAVGAATALRLNRLWAFIGSRVSNPLILPLVVFAELEVGHALRTGETITLSRSDVLARAPGLLVDWLIGTVPVGGGLGVLLGALAWAIASWRIKRRRARAPRPSSGSPPSGSPALPP